MLSEFGVFFGKVLNCASVLRTDIELSISVSFCISFGNFYVKVIAFKM